MFAEEGNVGADSGRAVICELRADAVVCVAGAVCEVCLLYTSIQPGQTAWTVFLVFSRNIILLSKIVVNMYKILRF